MGPESLQNRIDGGTGTPVPASALMMRYSRSTACAEGNSLPGGCLRTTRRRLSNVTKYVGFDCPPEMRSIRIGPSSPRMFWRK